jgi:predicted  nucleic acid-binding Zn-ribbon protein
VKREVLTKAIQDAEGEKSKFEEHIAVVRKRIAQLQDSLDRKVSGRF